MEASYFGAVVKIAVTLCKQSLTCWRVPGAAWPDLKADPAAKQDPLGNTAPPGGLGKEGPMYLCNSQVSAETAQANLSYPCKCCGTGLGIAHAAGQCSTDASTVRRLKNRGKTDWKKKMSIWR